MFHPSFHVDQFPSIHVAYTIAWTVAAAHIRAVLEYWYGYLSPIFACSHSRGEIGSINLYEGTLGALEKIWSGLSTRLHRRNNLQHPVMSPTHDYPSSGVMLPRVGLCLTGELWLTKCWSVVLCRRWGPWLPLCPIGCHPP